MSGSSTDELVLFDGLCGFCDRWVRWLLDHDVERRFTFAPLQGAAADALRARHPEIPVALDTVVFFEREGERETVWLRSAAVFAILARLPRPWRWLSILRVLPRPLTDLGYRAFASARYRVFGRRDTCRVPDAEQRARFLD